MTTAANALMATIHERMPVIIAKEHWQDWLAGPVEPVERLVKPYPDAEMQVWPVERRVSRAAEVDAGLIAPLVLVG